MDILDMKKTLKTQYTAKKSPQIITAVPVQYLMTDGQGDPGTSQEFIDAVEVLYPMVYGLKFDYKTRENGPGTFKAMPLEGLWYADDISVYKDGKRDLWKWTLMIALPDYVSQKNIDDIKLTLKKKKPGLNTEMVRMESLDEGLCVQVMHTGPYSKEGPVIKNMHDYASENGYTLRGHHHEIYLGDPRRSAPEKLKTILRHPLSE